MISRPFLMRGLALWLGALATLGAQTTYIPLSSSWRYLPGTAEASNPTSAWRQPGFSHAAWLVGSSPFWYGDFQEGGTQISEMEDTYTSLFFRKEFTVSNPTEIGELVLQAKSDDGFIAWINGIEVYRQNVAAQNPVFTDVATTSVPEPVSLTSNSLPDPRTYLNSGTNVLTVMGFNNTPSSSDFVFDASLRSSGSDATTPTIASVIPAPGELPALNQITVTFSEPVRGVTPDDLVINQSAATEVLGSGTTWTFTFDAPANGEVLISWSPAHDISDFATPTHAFNESGPGTTWSYTLRDATPPVQAGLNPPAGATVRSLGQVEITFNEPIAGIQATDLLVNGVPAGALVSSAGNKYTFSFPAQPAGTVNLLWQAAHGITDLAVPPNPFTGGSWSYTVDPNAAVGAVRINEIVAGNQNGITDENSEQQDWIEIHNPTSASVNLEGWSLSDDETYPDQWIFPARTLAPGAYLIVFCSGKDRRPASGNLHTNFKLSSPGGEFLALYDNQSPRQIVSGFSPVYPEQRNDFSYGMDAQAVWRYYAAPSPMAANGASSIAGVTAEPEFSVERGFFDTPFDLHLASASPGAAIRYTTDGSIPSATTGILYTGPIPITTTAAVRAAAFSPDSLPSLVRTHSYVFPSAVRNQSSAPPGFPTVWGTGGNQIAADYEVDPTVTNHPSYNATFESDLLAIPTLSIVMKQEDLFGPNGINSNPGGSGIAWERAASIELIYPDGRDGFQQDCGMRIQGGYGRSVSIKKHSFRPLFKSDYGESKLKFPLFEDSPVQEFDTFVLRAGMNNSYVLGTGEASRATFTEDEWMRQTQRAMGQVSGYGNFVHLYLNGLYWGLYNATERPSAPFAAGHFGGEKEDWDALNSSEPVDGNKTAWSTLLSLCSSGGSVRYIVNQAEWNQVMNYLDVDNLIDYMLLNFYGGNQDWDDHNWYSARRRAPGEGYKFFSWDGERTLEQPTGQDKTGVNQADKPSRIYAALRGSTNTTTTPLNPANVEFRMRFADHVQKHMFANGPLTPATAVTRWNGVEAQVDRAVVGESARWGDKLRETPYTRNVEFLAEVNRKRNTQFSQRTGSVLTMLRNAKLYPAANLVAPSLNQHGGKVAAGFSVTMTSGTPGTIYYTLDGSDPRAPWTSTSSGGSAVDWSGAVAAGAIAYAGPVSLEQSVVLKARARDTSTGLWSALTEAAFKVAELRPPIRITEIMYNPIGGEAYEFLELQNAGTTPVDLGLMHFEGIEFTFLRNTILGAGERLVLAPDVSPQQWALRYPGVTPAGYYDSALSNSGEYIALLDEAGNVVTSLTFGDGGRWPPAADGNGRSLELVAPDGDATSPESWRASLANNGTPGAANQTHAPAVRFHEVLARNAGAVANGASAPDYVELQNPGAATVDISGWSVRVEGFATGACVFPPGTTLPAGGLLVVWCGAAETGFKAIQPLQDARGFVTLNNQAGAIVDSVSWGEQVPDKSIGRVADAWQLTIPSPAAANIAAQLGSATQLAVNELLVKAAPQWVELHNRDTTLPVALTGISIQTGAATDTIRQPSYLAPGAFVRYMLGEPGFSQALDLSLAESDGAVAIYAANGAMLNQLAYASTQPEVSQGRLPDGTGELTDFPGSPTPAAPNALLSYSGPTISEVMANNRGAVQNAEGDWPDWIELHNAGPADFDMTGMKLRVNSRSGSAWSFPAGSIVPAGGYLRLWCDETSPAGATNVGQALADAGGGVWLYNTAGQQVDAIVYGHQAGNLSIGKTAGVWRLLVSPTPGTANSAAATLGAASDVRISEWMPAPEDGDDWVELHNPGALPVDLSGMYLTDTPSLAGRTNTQIAPLSFIGANGFAVFDASGDAATGAGHANFRLSDEGESIRLYTAALALVDGVDFGTTAADVSRGRYPSGGANQQNFTGTVSRGAENYIDTDNDGLPDAWESANGLSPALADAAADGDGDGATNAAEFLANTDPRNSASVLRAEVLSQELGFVIRFRAEEGRSYVVQVKNALADATWQKLRAVPAGTARAVDIADPAATGVRRFYRAITPAEP